MRKISLDVGNSKDEKNVLRLDLDNCTSVGKSAENKTNLSN